MLLRPDTVDRKAWREIYVRNAYFLPARLAPSDVVIDIGAHIGSFTLAALDRGAGQVWAFEADAGNYALASLNVKEYVPRVRLTHAAVWRSDVRIPHVYFSGYAPSGHREVVNTGGGDVMFHTDGTAIPTIRFDDVIDEASDAGARRIRLVKLDCEGSEFPILLTSSRLDLIDEIVGEYHAIPAEQWSHLRDDARVGIAVEYSPALLREHLECVGFRVRLGHCGRTLGQFMAWRA